MRKLLLLMIKYIPVIQMAGMLFNNLLYYINACREISYIIDFTIGSSISMTIVSYICSYTFKFCVWHRLIITANFINLIIANIDAIIGIPISDIKLLGIYYTIAVIFIIICLIIHFRNYGFSFSKRNS